MSLSPRFAVPQDAPALLDIYRAYIATTITFEYDLPDEAEFARRMTDVQSRGLPYLVLEQEGRPVGYAYAHPLFSRAAYQWDVELTVYLSPAVSGRGAGPRLYTLLLDLLRLQGVRTAYALVTDPNPASQKMHRALGFSLMGTLRRTGYKNGQWLDVSWFEKRLNPFTEAPEAVRAISALDEEAVNALLARAFSS